MTAFGPDFFAPNLGLLYTATLFYFGIIMIVSQVNFLVALKDFLESLFPCQIPALFDLMGYSGMFVMAGVFGLLGIFVTCFMPQDIRCELSSSLSLSLLDVPRYTIIYVQRPISQALKQLYVRFNKDKSSSHITVY